MFFTRSLNKYFLNKVLIKIWMGKESGKKPESHKKLGNTNFWVSGSQTTIQNIILTRKRNDQARRMYRRMKMQRSKTRCLPPLGAVLWRKNSHWVRKAFAQAVENYWLNSYSILCGASNNSSMSMKPEAGDFRDACPTFWSPVFEVLFFQYLRAQKPSKKHVGQPVTMLQGFSVL